MPPPASIPPWVNPTPAAMPPVEVVPSTSGMGRGMTVESPPNSPPKKKQCVEPPLGARGLSVVPGDGRVHTQVTGGKVMHSVSTQILTTKLPLETPANAGVDRWQLHRYRWLSPESIDVAHYPPLPLQPPGDRTHVIAFSTPHHPLSNLFPCDIVFRGRLFKSAEHAYQYEKALCLKEPELADVIWKATDGYNAKRFAKPLSNHPLMSEWLLCRHQIMCAIVEHKYCQVPLFQEEINQAGSPYLVENTPNQFWAAGKVLRSPSVKEIRNLPGRNALGCMMMRLADRGTLIQTQHWPLYDRRRFMSIKPN